MKRVFISQPMKGKTGEFILAERGRAIEETKKYIKDDIEVIDSFVQNAPSDAKPLWFLGKSLELMSKADVAVFTRGWHKYRGCRIEHSCALEYGIGIISL